MQIGYTHSARAAFVYSEPLASCDSGTISAIERNGRRIDSYRFHTASHLSALWRELWSVYGKPAGDPDRPYITIKRDSIR